MAELNMWHDIVYVGEKIKHLFWPQFFFFFLILQKCKFFEQSK